MEAPLLVQIPVDDARESLHSKSRKVLGKRYVLLHLLKISLYIVDVSDKEIQRDPST